MTVIQFAPEWEVGVVERFFYQTDVIVSEDLTEQRIKLRGSPRREAEFVLLGFDPQYINRLFTTMMVQQEASIWVPLWWDAVLLTADASIGGTSLTIDTVGRDFIAQNHALVWRTDDIWEEITVNSVLGSSITCSALTKAWPANTTYVVPCFNMRWEPEVPWTRQSMLISEARVRMRTV